MKHTYNFLFSFFFIAVILGCSNREDAKEQADSLLEDVNSGVHSKFNQLKQETERYQNEWSNGNHTDFKIQGTLELGHTYDKASLITVYENSEQIINISFETDGKGIRAYYLLHWLADQDIPAIIQVGRTTDTNTQYGLSAIPCHECSIDTWVVFETNRNNILKEEGAIRTINFLENRFIENINFAAPQNRLNRWRSSFEEDKNNYQQLSYQETHEYESKTTTFFYAGDQLVYVFYDYGVEGGEGYQRLLGLNKKNDGVSDFVLDAHYQKDGYFSYTSNGVVNSYKIYPMDQIPPTIYETAEKRLYEYREELSSHLEYVFSNKSRFGLENGKYIFYVKRDTVNSEYGEVEVYQRYELDSTLFNTQQSN